MKFCCRKLPFCCLPKFTRTKKYSKNKLSKLSFDDVSAFSLNGETHQGKILYAYDGDTVTVGVNVFGKDYRFSSRLMGIDTPELKQPVKQAKRDELKNVAYLARNRVIQLTCDVDEDFNMDEHYTPDQVKEMCGKSTKMVTVTFGEFDKYGRPLVMIMTPDGDVATILKNENLGLDYNGATKGDPLFILKVRSGESEETKEDEVSVTSDGEAKIAKLKAKAEARTLARKEALEKIKKTQQEQKERKAQRVLDAKAKTAK